MPVELSEFRGVLMTRSGPAAVLPRPPLAVHPSIELDASGPPVSFALGADTSMVRVWADQAFAMRVDRGDRPRSAPKFGDGATEMFPPGETTIGINHNDGTVRIRIVAAAAAMPQPYEPEAEFAAAPPGTSLAAFGWERRGRQADSWRPVTTATGGIEIIEEAEPNLAETIWTRAVERAAGELRFAASIRPNAAASDRGELRMLLACAGLSDHIAIHITTAVGAYEIIRRQGGVDTPLAGDSVGPDGFLQPVPFIVTLDPDGAVAVQVPGRSRLVRPSGLSGFVPAIGIAAKPFAIGRNVLIDDLRFIP